MAYRDDRDSLRARVETLEEELERAKEASVEVVLFPRKTPAQRRKQALVAGGVVLAVVGLGVGAWQWSARAAEREIGAAWGALSGCMLGDPLGPTESARARTRRIQLAWISRPRSAEERWPGRCQKPAHQLYLRLRENGRAAQGQQDAAYWAEQIAAKIERGTADDEVLGMLEPLTKKVREAGITIAPAVIDVPAPAPASPLRLADLAGAVVSPRDMPATSLYTELLAGVDRHVLVDDPGADAMLCTLVAATGAFTCRPLPGELAKKHGLRLLGTTDAGAAPLIFAGRDGEGGIHRGDTGELVASTRAHGAYAAADGYVAIQTWPGHDDGSFDVLEQRRPGAEVKKTRVTPKAQASIQPTTTIHRSRLLWDKVVLQMIDQRKLDTSPWIAAKTLGREELGGAFHRVADLNWINTNVMGCRGTQGTVARFGPSEAMLLFNEGDRWQGPLFARGLGDVLRCDGRDAVFLTGWPVRVKRCTPAGCDEQTPDEGEWPTAPARGTSTVALDLLDGKAIAVWWTDKHGVRVRVGPPPSIGKASDVVVFDDLADPQNELSRMSVLSGIRLLSAGRTAMLLLATTSGVRAVRLGADGTFAPATVGR